jgi:SAM-dependent methyltransferase
LHASPFDELADSYDRDFTRSACGRTLRSTVWASFPRVFAGRARLLEIGSGTGEDAIQLARAGHHVLGIDASAEMLRIARLKAAAAGVGDRIDFRVLPVESLNTLPAEWRFDAVFSNFGAINCVADLPRMARDLAARLAPGSPLLFVAMGRYVPWEWAWYLAHGDRTRAFRRLARDGVAWRGLTIRYPTPANLSKALGPWFLTRARSALGFALPPSYASSWLETRPRWFAALASIERATRRLTAGLADHYMLEAVCT